MSACQARVQRAMALTGPIMLVMWIGSFVVLARFIPPPSPTADPDDILRLYSDHLVSLRIGLVLTMMASALLVPFAAVISSQIRRMEGAGGPLALTQVVSAGLLSLEFIIPMMVWLTAAYRLDEASARLIQMLNDMGWLMFVAVISSALVQIVSFGVAILVDDRDNPVLPRWSGYFMLWVALLLSPTAMCVFFKSGPFAWNGLFAFYIPVCTFAVWMFVTYWLLRRAISEQQAHAAHIGDETVPAPA